MYTTGQQKSNTLFSRKVQPECISFRYSVFSAFFRYGIQEKYQTPIQVNILKIQWYKFHTAIQKKDYSGILFCCCRQIIHVTGVLRRIRASLSPFSSSEPVRLAQDIKAREHKACQGQDGADTDHEGEVLVQKDM